MTEEEKKEFEEFLKWKAEKAKLEASTETEVSSAPVDAEGVDTLKDKSSQGDVASNSGSNKEISNTGLCVLTAIIVVLLLLALNMALSVGKQKNLAETAVTEKVEEDTVVAIAPDDKVIQENTKVTWDFTIVKDEIYDTNNVWAEIQSDNYISQGFPYEGCTYATICVRYMKKYGYDVIIAISQGQIHGNRYNGDNYISVRFDEGTPKKYYFNDSSDGSSDKVFLNNKSDFIKRCKQAKDIKIDIPIFQAGRPLFTFHVDEPLIWRNEY